ncbi:MAG: glycosyltransferase family 4 protein [Actinomycetaceae bacterium]|nr:glycosyltransferase family 4 protein [Actinomycetaceae bacterium]MDY6082700.1 glycosyltransferase family 4 protein [Actinomycetaceae bacterium]
MHILFVTQQWQPETGVAQRRARWMADQFLHAGASVSVICPPPHYPKGKLLSDDPRFQAHAVATMEHGETVYRSNFRPHTNKLTSRIVDQAVIAVSSLRSARIAVRAQKPDLVFCTTPPLPAAFTAAIVAWRSHVPYIIDLRDAWPELVPYTIETEREPGQPRKTARSYVRALILRPILAVGGALFEQTIRGASGVITTSAEHARLIRSERGIPSLCLSNLLLAGEEMDSAPTDSTGTVATACSTLTDDAPGSVAPATETPVDRTRSSLLRSSMDGSGAASTAVPTSVPTLNVLYPGTIGRAQGLENAIRAVAIAQEAGVRVNLLFVGGGVHRPIVRREVRWLHLETVHFIDWVSRDDLQAYTDAADTILVHLQDWPPLEHTVPSKVFDAIASGKFVTIAANGEAAQLVIESGAGRAVPAMNPRALADLWISLATDRAQLDTHQRGPQWINERRQVMASAKELDHFIHVVCAAHDSAQQVNKASTLPEKARRAVLIAKHMGINTVHFLLVARSHFKNQGIRLAGGIVDEGSPARQHEAP